MSNADIFKQLMKDYGLTRKQTADLLEIKEVTLDSWLRPKHNKCYRPLPDREVTFLKCLLRPRSKQI